MERKSLYGDYKDKNSLLTKESWDFRSSRSIFGGALFQGVGNQQSLARALLLNPGRFQSPLSITEKLRLWLQSKSLFSDYFQLSHFFFSPSTKDFLPYPWQVLFRFLKREGLIKEMEATPCLFLYDQPKMLSFRLTSPLPNLNGRGNGPDLETALSKTVGELLERTFLSRKYRTYQLIASVSELKQKARRCLDLSTLIQSNSKVGAVEDVRTKWHWVRGRSLTDGGRVWIPAQAVFMGGPFPGEPLLREGNSNGSAGGFSRNEAALAGIYELIERDSFLIFWLNNIAPPVVDVTQFHNEELQELLRYLERYRFEAVFLDTTTEIGIPACVCVLIDRSQLTPRFSIGGGAGFDLSKMLLSSLREAIVVYGGGDSYFNQPELSADYLPFIDEKINLDYRIKLWKNPMMFPKFEFFLSGKHQSFDKSFGYASWSTETCTPYTLALRKLHSLGPEYEPYIYEAQNSVLDTLDFHVVKVVIPATITLNLSEANAPIRAKRLQTAPLAMGYAPAKKLNPWPHPFP